MTAARQVVWGCHCLFACLLAYHKRTHRRAGHVMFDATDIINANSVMLAGDCTRGEHGGRAPGGNVAFGHLEVAKQVTPHNTTVTAAVTAACGQPYVGISTHRAYLLNCSRASRGRLGVQR